MPTPAPATVLITSVGSLIGRGLLDVLWGRRDGLRIVGVDADPTAPALAECDVAVTVPVCTDPDYADAIEQVYREQGAELALAGRDPDTVVLADLAERPGAVVRTVGPPAELARVAADKWSTAQWCDAHGVPFAPSLCTDVATQDQLTEFAAVHGFPLIAKPRDGSGSLGVRVVTDEDQLRVAAGMPGMVVQPFLTPPTADELALDTSAGLPLFWEIPVRRSPCINATVGADGEIGPFLTSEVSYRLGWVEEMVTARDPELDALAERIVPIFRDGGWRGPLSLPLRRGPDGYHLIEINPRFSGGTSSRLWLGLDEVRWVLNREIGRDVLPPFDGRIVDRVVRTFTQYPADTRP